MSPVAVCLDVEVAVVLVERGAQVVLYGSQAEELVAAVDRLRGSAGRVAVLVGDPADPAVAAAAVAMAAELFGGEATLVSSMSEAGQFQAPSSTLGDAPDTGLEANPRSHPDT